MEQSSLAERVGREIARQAELDVVVEEDSGVLVLSGMVDSVEDRQAAEDIARSLAGELQVDNGLDVPAQVTDTAADLTADEPTLGTLPVDADELREMGEDLEPSLTDQPLLTDPMAAAGPSSELEDPAAAGDEVYVPPTDPVITTSDRGEAEVLGGFGTTSTDEVEVVPSAMDGRPGDEALEEAVRRALLQDASTTELRVRVVVRNGVAHLRGIVPGMEDADNAEEVASRVPGIREVVEELEVQAV